MERKVGENYFFLRIFFFSLLFGLSFIACGIGNCMHVFVLRRMLRRREEIFARSMVCERLPPFLAYRETTNREKV